MCIFIRRGTIAPVYDFRPLYRRLSCLLQMCCGGKGRVWILSEISAKSRRLDVMLEETRRALILAGKEGPYVLLPHSMSGLEAIYWAQKYPQEIKAIIGLDMAFPEAYEKAEDAGKGIGLLRLAAMLGLHRLPLFSLAADDGLTEEEYAQAKLLAKRNFMNRCIAAETDIVYENAALVGKSGLPEVPFTVLLRWEGSG